MDGSEIDLSGSAFLIGGVAGGLAITVAALLVSLAARCSWLHFAAIGLHFVALVLAPIVAARSLHEWLAGFGAAHSTGAVLGAAGGGLAVAAIGSSLALLLVSLGALRASARPGPSADPPSALVR